MENRTDGNGAYASSPKRTLEELDRLDLELEDIKYRESAETKPMKSANGLPSSNARVDNLANRGVGKRHD